MASVNDQYEEEGDVGSRTRDPEFREMLPTEEAESESIGALVERITDDLKAIGRDEIQLAKAEIAIKAKSALVDVSVVILSGIILLIAIGFASVAVVDALEPILSPLWARLLIMAVVYAALCGTLLFTYARKLKRDITPVAPKAAEHASRTAKAVKEELRHA
jgi:hypothetical protein